MAIAVALLIGLFSVSAKAAPAAVKAQIEKLESDISVAYAANDLPRYFAYYAEDLRALFPEGITTLPEYRTSWTAYIKGGGAILAFNYSNLVVQVSPSEDVAVASYTASVRSKDSSGAVTDEKYLETDVFFKRHNQWKIVEIHYSPIPEPKK